MARFICHYNGVFNIFSTISDDMFYRNGLTKEQLTEVIQRDGGQTGVRELPYRLERSYATGSSEMNGASAPLEEYWSVMQRLHEEGLTYEEWLKKYFTLKGE